MDENNGLMKAKLAPLPPEMPKVVEHDPVRWVIGGVAALIIAGMLITGYIYREDVIKEDMIKHAAIQLLTDSKKEAISRVIVLTEEKKVLEEKLNRLKTKEGLAQRDLEEYIIKKYRVVPKIVAKEVSAQTVKLTKEEAVPFSLIVGIMEVESQFKPWLVSKKDARGLMQVMPFWVKNQKVDLGLKSKYDLHDIGVNIKAGIAVFKIHLKEANNDVNQGLYLYVGKDRTYANKVFNAMGKFEVFRSTLDTTLRDEENQENSEAPPANGGEKKAE